MEDLELKPIVGSWEDPIPEGAVIFGGPEVPDAVHGTYLKAWPVIRKEVSKAVFMK